MSLLSIHLHGSPIQASRYLSPALQSTCPPIQDTHLPIAPITLLSSTFTRLSQYLMMSPPIIHLHDSHPSISIHQCTACSSACLPACLPFPSTQDTPTHCAHYLARLHIYPFLAVPRSNGILSPKPITSRTFERTNKVAPLTANKKTSK